MNINLAYIIKLFLPYMSIAVEKWRDKLILQLYVYHILWP